MSGSEVKDSQTPVEVEKLPVSRITCELKITKTWQTPDLPGITEESESDENADDHVPEDEQFSSPVL